MLARREITGLLEQDRYADYPPLIEALAAIDEAIDAAGKWARKAATIEAALGDITELGDVRQQAKDAVAAAIAANDRARKAGRIDFPPPKQLPAPKPLPAPNIGPKLQPGT